VLVLENAVFDLRYVAYLFFGLARWRMRVWKLFGLRAACAGNSVCRLDSLCVMCM
jgi:hypothetical protein